MGVVGHYIADLHMPLHTVINYNGQLEESDLMSNSTIYLNNEIISSSFTKLVPMVTTLVIRITSFKQTRFFLFCLITKSCVIYSLIFLTIVFFILSLSIKTSEIIKILLFPFVTVKKIINLFKKNKKNDNVNTNISKANLEQQNYGENTSKEIQPILHFSNKKKERSADNIFKLQVYLHIL